MFEIGKPHPKKNDTLGRKGNKKHVKLSIYVRDREDFDQTMQDIYKLWFHIYGEPITNSLMLIKALTFFREYLKGYKGDIASKDADKGQDIHKYSRIKF